MSNDDAALQSAGSEPADATEQTGTAPPGAGNLACLAELEGIPTETVRGRPQLYPSRDSYLGAVQALRSAGFELCSDLCGVDYLRHPARPLPPGVSAERFEVVVQLTSISRRERLSVRVQVPETDPRLSTLFYVYPGAEAMEREAFDMFGITFTDHPDMTRILMPEDWEGYPLRKDYSVGRVPVQFKEAPGPR
ncbi:MAG: NADH-quinone oxidoreductase subunit C [Acidimicrobiales bacterium]